MGLELLGRHRVMVMAGASSRLLTGSLGSLQGRRGDAEVVRLKVRGQELAEGCRRVLEGSRGLLHEDGGMEGEGRHVQGLWGPEVRYLLPGSLQSHVLSLDDRVPLPDLQLHQLQLLEGFCLLRGSLCRGPLQLRLQSGDLGFQTADMAAETFAIRLPSTQTPFQVLLLHVLALPGLDFSLLSELQLFYLLVQPPSDFPL